MNRGAGSPGEEAPALTALGGTSRRTGAGEGPRERRFPPDRRWHEATRLTIGRGLIGDGSPRKRCPARYPALTEVNMRLMEQG
jgi:hypothetical protein